MHRCNSLVYPVAVRALAANVSVLEVSRPSTRPLLLETGLSSDGAHWSTDIDCEFSTLATALGIRIVVLSIIGIFRLSTEDKFFHNFSFDGTVIQ